MTDEERDDARREAPGDDERFRRLIDAAAESALEESDEGILTEVETPFAPDHDESIRKIQFDMTRVDPSEEGKRRQRELFREFEEIGEKHYDIPATPEERKARLDEIVVRVPNLRGYIAESLERYKSFSDEDVVRQLRRWAPLGDLTDFINDVLEWADGRKRDDSIDVEKGPPLYAGKLRESSVAELAIARKKRHEELMAKYRKPLPPEQQESVRQVEFAMVRVDDKEGRERRREEFYRKMERMGEELYDIPATPEERKARLDAIVLRVPNLRGYVAESLEEYQSFSDEEITRQLRRWAPLGDLTDINREIVEWGDGRRTGGVDEGPPLRAGTLRESAAAGDEDPEAS